MKVSRLYMFFSLVFSCVGLHAMYAKTDCADLLKLIEKKDVRFIDLDFTDLFGNLKTYTITAKNLSSVLDSGICFDGSSVKGFSHLANSDLHLRPVLETFTILPWTSGKEKTASMMCDMYDSSDALYALYPRTILKKVSQQAADMGYIFNVSPEIEFFILKQYPLSTGIHNALPDCDGYCDPASRLDVHTLKLTILNALEDMNLSPEKVHHEVASSQHEITMKYDSALRMADKLILAKKAMRYLARSHGFYITFMPKPIEGENGSGMHINYSLYHITSKKNAFFNVHDSYLLSDTARSFIAGNMQHIHAMTAVLNPTINSYKRLIPGYEAPVYVSWGMRNRSSMIRIPDVDANNSNAVRAELRSSDAMANPYLAFALLLASGLDGIIHDCQIAPASEVNLFEYSLDDVLKMGIDILPTSLDLSLDSMQQSDFVNQIIGSNLCNQYVDIKRKEVADFKKTVSLWELERYL